MSYKNNNLITLYQERFHLKNAILSRIEHDDAIVAIVYMVLLPNNLEYILKICTRPVHYFCEVYFLNHFSSILPVPRIIQVVEPEVDINGAILMEYLPGALLKRKDLNYSLAYEAGSMLARIHSNRAIGYEDLTQPHNLSSDSSFYFTLKFEQGLSECRHHLHNTLLEQYRRYFYTHINLFNFCRRTMHHAS
jgi:hypothetical protein